MRCGVTGNRVIAPGTPMAASMAEAMAAADPVTPASPAPLMPSGLRALGASSVSYISCDGTSPIICIR